MKKKNKIPFDAVMAIVVMILVGIMALDGFVLHKLPMDALKYPIFVFSVVLVLGVWEVVRGLKVSKGEDYKPLKIFENRKNYLVIAGMIIGFVLLAWLLGFAIAAIIFSIAFAWYFKFKHMVPFCIAAVIVSVGLYYCFVKLFYIFLPTGVLLEKLF